MLKSCWFGLILISWDCFICSTLMVFFIFSKTSSRHFWDSSRLSFCPSDLFSESGQMVVSLRRCWLLFHALSFLTELQALKTPQEAQWQLWFHFQQFQGRNLQWLIPCSAPSSQLVHLSIRSEELNFHKSYTFCTEGQPPQSDTVLCCTISLDYSTYSEV